MCKFHIDSAIFFLKYGDDGFNDRSSTHSAKKNVLFPETSQYVLRLVVGKLFFFFF